MDRLHHYTRFHSISYKILFWKRSQILCTTLNPHCFKLSSRVAAYTNHSVTPISFNKLDSDFLDMLLNAVQYNPMFLLGVVGGRDLSSFFRNKEPVV